MFGFLRSKRSLVRRELDSLLWVRRTWFEWSIEDGLRRCVLVVEMDHDLDPRGAHFEMERLVEVDRTVARCAEIEKGPDRVRIVPCVNGG